MRRIQHPTVIPFSIVLLITPLLFAQEAPAPADRAPFVELTDEDFETILKEMTPEEMEQLVQTAAKRCLEVERRQVAAEIRENLLYDEAAVEKALRILDAGKEAPPTRRENIQRICRAFAAVDESFAEAYTLYQEKKYDQAAERFKDSLNPEDASYFSAAVHFLHAESLVRRGKLWAGVETYSDLLVNLPDRISFAAAAALRAAETYERMGRNLYAMQMYAYCLNNYALTMDEDERISVNDRYEKLEGIYRDPMSSLTGMVAHVHERLAKRDVGEGTRRRQKDVVALLEDLIKTNEEKRRPKENDNQNRNRRRGEQNQQDQAQQGGGSKKSTHPAGTPRNPTVGAKESVLVPGPVSRPNKLAKIHAGRDVGKWAQLPPRQKEAIRNLMRQRLAERRGQMVRDYHRKLAEGE